MRKGISWNHHQCSVLLEKETENIQILQAKVGRKLIFFPENQDIYQCKMVLIQQNSQRIGDEKLSSKRK